jgi:hypothetical protein
MKNIMRKLLAATFICLIASIAFGQIESDSLANDKLVIVWTSDDPYLAERMVLMYAHAAKTAGWFSDVTLIIWGPSAKLVAENIKIQEKLLTMQKDGIVIEVCIVCANAYGVTEDLRKLDFDIKGMGKPLTDYLKSEAKMLTF